MTGESEENMGMTGELPENMDRAGEPAESAGMNPDPSSKAAVCGVCFHRCHLKEGQTGFCRARKNTGGKVRPVNYGELTSLALDPIEKKPLARFYPGSMILSVGSFGCNLACPFCQNYEISCADRESARTRSISPSGLCALAESLKSRGNIGIAYTYNEPLIGWEFVRDTARLVREQGMKNVLVSNGTAGLPVLRALRPYIDAMNIDLKSFRPDYYEKVLRGNLDQVKDWIRESVRFCHVELTTLVVPGANDREDEIRAMAEWIASLDNGAGEIPWHLTRFFPRHRMTDRSATDIALIRRLADIARESLRYVYTGNC